MKDLLANNISALTLLVGVLAGHVLTIISPYLQRRIKRIELSNELRFWLYELWFVLDCKPIIGCAKEMARIVTKLDPSLEAKKVYKDYFVIFVELIKNTDENKRLIQKINFSLSHNVKLLSSFDPLMAFKISGVGEKIDYKTKVNELVNKLDVDEKSINDGNQLMSMIEGYIDEAFGENDLPDQILGLVNRLAFISGFREYYKAKKYEKKLRKLQKSELKKYLDAMGPKMEEMMKAEYMRSNR